MPYVKNKIAVNVPHRSGYDKSNRHSGTILPGTITPLLFDELIPNTRTSLRINLAAQLPPLVSDTYMNAKLKVEAFFVPMRICCKSFEDFFCDFPRRVFTASSASSDQGASGTAFSNVTAACPLFRISYASTPLGPGTLTDYLGVKVSQPTAQLVTPIDLSVMPYVAYHLCWQEYYRQPRVQNPAFAPDLGSLAPTVSNAVRGATLPFQYFHRPFTGAGGTSYADNSVIPVSTAGQLNALNCADGVSIFALRQRNFGLDYFTGARVSAQQGQPAAVSFTVPVTGTDDGSGNVTGSGTGSISIAQIRAQNSLQQFRERENIPSPRMTDQVRARYNANLADGVAQRPIVIGVASYDISTRGVDQTAPSSAVNPGTNPFSAVGAQYGRGYGVGSDFIIDNFVANEPGYLLVNLTLVPEVTYSSGTPKLFSRYLTEGSITDMACSLLQNVGDQPVYVSELHENGYSPGGSVFGYQDRYADFMFMVNRCSGKFRDGESLDSFVLQRSFGIGPSLNTQFLEIPTTYFDQVFQVATGTSGVGCWFDAMLDYKVSMPLAEFSIPSLQDPAYEHGERVVLRRNGQVF